MKKTVFFHQNGLQLIVLVHPWIHWVCLI